MSSSDKKILIIFIGVLALVASYYFGYKKFDTSNNQLKADNAVLSEQLDELSLKVQNEKEYVSETSRMKNEISALIAEFPSYLQIEDSIMDTVEMEKKYDVEVPTLSVSDPTQVVGGQASEDGSQTASSKYSVYSINSNISYTSSYAGLKQMINCIAEDRSISSLSATFDRSTGKLSGSVSYNDFFIYGQDDKEYQLPNIYSVMHGTNNIFGTVDAPAATETTEETTEETTSTTNK